MSKRHDAKRTKKRKKGGVRKNYGRENNRFDGVATDTVGCGFGEKRIFGKADRNPKSVTVAWGGFEEYWYMGERGREQKTKGTRSGKFNFGFWGEGEY